MQLGTADKEGIMVDLETLSSEPNAAIIAIGAVKFKFNGEIGEKFYRTVSAQDSEKAGLHISASTVMWWLEQSAEARNRVCNDTYPLAETLDAFAEWYGEDKTMPIWGNGATFDNVVLRSAYSALSMECPWSYKADRCYRTIKGLYTGKLPEMEGLVAHNALDDAIYQAKMLQIMMGFAV